MHLRIRVTTAQIVGGHVQSGTVSRRQDHRRPIGDESFRTAETDAGPSARDECDVIIESAHPTSVVNAALRKRPESIRSDRPGFATMVS